MTELRLRYRQERKNARRRIKYARLKGFDVEGIRLPEGITAKTPDTEVLEKIAQLKQIGIKSIREKLKAPVVTKSFKILDELKKKIDEFSPLESWSDEMRKRKQDIKSTLKIMLEGAIIREGIEAVGERLEQSAMSLNLIIDQILYDSDQDTVNFNLNELAAIINASMTDMSTNKMLTELSDFIQ